MGKVGGGAVEPTWLLRLSPCNSLARTYLGAQIHSTATVLPSIWCVHPKAVECHGCKSKRQRRSVYAGRIGCEWFIWRCSENWFWLGSGVSSVTRDGCLFSDDTNNITQSCVWLYQVWCGVAPYCITDRCHVLPPPPLLQSPFVVTIALPAATLRPSLGVGNARFVVWDRS